MTLPRGTGTPGGQATPKVNTVSTMLSTFQRSRETTLVARRCGGRSYTVTPHLSKTDVGPGEMSSRPLVVRGISPGVTGFGS